MSQNAFGSLSKLTLIASLKENKTIISSLDFTAPFKIMHPFYEKKDRMSVMLLSASAGLMSGDQQLIDIQVLPGARMEFTSQAYEKIHKMNDGYAERSAHITIDEDAFLFYNLKPVLPFKDSDYRANLKVDLKNESSQFILSEILICGRLYHSERFEYKRFDNRIRIYQDGKLIYFDNTRYEPEKMDMEGFGFYEGFTHLANLIICNIPGKQNWFEKVREFLDGEEDIQGGITEAQSNIVNVRILGNNAQQLEKILETIIEIL